MIDTDREQAVDPSGEAAAPASPATVTVPGGTVYLHPTITIALGIAAMAAIRSVSSNGGGEADMLGALGAVYLHHGIASWTFPDPVTPANADRLLPFAAGGLEVAEAADALYAGELFAPLVKRQAASLLTGQTVSPMSPSPVTGSKRRTRSGRSSRNGTAGKR